MTFSDRTKGNQNSFCTRRGFIGTKGESQGQGRVPERQRSWPGLKAALPGALRMQRGIWQRRFWEHAIRDEGDDARHLDYVHFRPVKHGCVSAVAHWPRSTFHRWVKAGAYPRDWGGEVRWTLPPSSIDDNLVTCHSAEHPCGASALTTRAHLMFRASRLRCISCNSCLHYSQRQKHRLLSGFFDRFVRPSQILRSSKMKYRVLIEQDEDGVFVADVPALPGCISQGKTRTEALNNIQEAIEAYLESLRAHDEPVPPSIDEEVIEIVV
ncbi:MAG: REP-associated tyrosine transposase [Chromatiales bacterium USCg_Taylor]|nr:MAG: REP-associated tyrosine transposase [Chromatiales bacterium USCg_Taylor]